MENKSEELAEKRLEIRRCVLRRLYITVTKSHMNIAFNSSQFSEEKVCQNWKKMQRTLKVKKIPSLEGRNIVLSMEAVFVK